MPAVQSGRPSATSRLPPLVRIAKAQAFRPLAPASAASAA